ncbi:MAG: stage II sporulation protein M [Firmicutes bacterium]|nr:stage II sporulation protein M [Bacillota bacterium]
MFPIGSFLKQNKNWVIIAALIFIGGVAVAGYSLPPALGSAVDPEQLVGLQADKLEHFQEIFQNMSSPMLVLVIFITNLTSMGQMLLLGFLAGLSPLFTLFINGSLVGALTASLAHEGLSPWLSLGLGVLPHGIFELSAFFICGALGLKFGYHCVASPLPGLSRRESFFFIWREVATMLPTVILLLIVGALVEVYISKILVLKYLAG